MDMNFKKIWDMDSSATTPFIMVTAIAKSENASKQADINSYIVKFFNAQTLKRKIESVFN